MWISNIQLQDCATTGSFRIKNIERVEMRQVVLV